MIEAGENPPSLGNGIVLLWPAAVYPKADSRDLPSTGPAEGLRLRTRLQSFGASRSFQPRVTRSLAQPSAKTPGASALTGSFFMERSSCAGTPEPFDAQPRGRPRLLRVAPDWPRQRPWCTCSWRLSVRRPTPLGSQNVPASPECRHRGVRGIAHKAGLKPTAASEGHSAPVARGCLSVGRHRRGDAWMRGSQ